MSRIKRGVLFGYVLEKGAVSLNLKQLEIFVKTVEVSSFSAAAREIYLSQPTISSYISGLEKELNIHLFVRKGKRVDVSDDGKILYQYAKQMLDVQKKITNTFQTQKEEHGSCVKISASTIPFQYLLHELITEFNAITQGVKFDVFQTDSSHVIEDILSGNAEIGFTGTCIRHKNCKYIPIYQDELVLITPNTEFYRTLHKESNGQICDIDWLGNESFIMREVGSGTRKEAEYLLKQMEVEVSSLNTIASIQNHEVIKKLVKNKIGVSIISRLAVQNSIDEEEVLAFTFPIDSRYRNIYLVYNKEFQLSEKGEIFLKIVKK